MNSQLSRRYQTAKNIQSAAITLATKDGLNNITTEAIASAAGVSARTFFNYYPYKEAALMGPPPDYPENAVEAFINGNNSLLDDLRDLITAHLTRFLHEKELLAQLLKLSEQDPKLMALRNNAILARRSKMAELLQHRMPDADPRMIHILSAAIIGATNNAAQIWATGQVDDFVGAALENLAFILPAAELLNQK